MVRLTKGQEGIRRAEIWAAKDAFEREAQLFH
jgi:hypothetical protein